MFAVAKHFSIPFRLQYAFRTLDQFHDTAKRLRIRMDCRLG
ncbi:hypothetical protein BDI4_10167 [Burkholderia diffusa]|nr:hypothetical protein BDI4_10167 [Burkholderia diffusa]